MKPTEFPSRDEIDRLMESLGPRIERLFRQYGISAEEAERHIGEALTALIYMWGWVRNPEWWMLDRLEKAAQRTTSPPEVPRP